MIISLICFTYILNWNFKRYIPWKSVKNDVYHVINIRTWNVLTSSATVLYMQETFELFHLHVHRFTIKFAHDSVDFLINILRNISQASIAIHEWFIVLFVWGFSSHSRIFHSYGDVTIDGEGLQILTCARHSWPLSSEGYLAFHIYCDTGHPFLVVISKDPWHSHLLTGV